MRDHNGGKITEIRDWKEFLKRSIAEFEERFQTRSTADAKIEDFETLETLGVGGFGRVLLARKNTTKVYYAVKVLDKANVIKLKQVKHCFNEKQILKSIMFPFCVYMEHFFQDDRHLYFVMPAVLGGELFRHLKKIGTLSEKHAKFYAAQILLALEYLHNLDLLYRDLKPENILLDHTGYVKMTDFGFCKHVKGRTYTLCGTPEYLAPEIILSKGYGKSVDWWSFGVLIYEMVAGHAPFSGINTARIYEKVVNGKYSLPEGFSAELKEVVRNTLQIDVSRRYGVGKGKRSVKGLRWFRDTEWMSILNKKLEPPFLPKIREPSDTSNFEDYDDESEEEGKKIDKCSFKDDFAEF